MNSEISILNLSIKDFFSKEILKLLLVVIVIVAAIFALFFSYISSFNIEFNGNMNYKVESYSKELLPSGEVVEKRFSEVFNDSNGNTKISLLENEKVREIFYLVSSVFFGFFSIFITAIVVGFFIKRVLIIIVNRHYQDLQLPLKFSASGYIFEIVKLSIISMIISIILIPTYFIPILNFLFINVAFYYFFHKVLNFQITSTISNKDNFQEIFFIRKSSNIPFKTACFYLLSLIPFVAVFLTLWYVIYLGHSYLSLVSK